jgi:hypothetical protein
MARQQNDVWHFTFTLEQTDTLLRVLRACHQELLEDSNVNLAKTIASARVNDLINLINDTTG